MTNLILASSSKSRANILKQMRYYPDLVVSPEIDETPKEKEKFTTYVLRMASEKAKKVSILYPESVVLSADTICVKNKMIMQKPSSEEEAVKYMKIFSGSRHRVYTAICVMRKEEIKTRIEYTLLKFKHLSKHEIELFVSNNDWSESSGGYKISSFSGIFLEWMQGKHTTVEGLPACTTYKLLISFGLQPRV